MGEVVHTYRKKRAMPRTGRVLDAQEKIQNPVPSGNGGTSGGGSSSWSVIFDTDLNPVVSNFKVYSSAAINKWFFQLKNILVENAENSDEKVFSAKLSMSYFFKTSNLVKSGDASEGNDSTVFTTAKSLALFAKKTDIPDTSGFLTQSDLNGYATTEDLNKLRDEIIGMLPEGGGSK